MEVMRHGPQDGAVVSVIVKLLLTADVNEPSVAVSVQEVPPAGRSMPVSFKLDTVKIPAEAAPLVPPCKVKPVHVPPLLVSVTVLVSLVHTFPPLSSILMLTLPRLIPIAALAGCAVKTTFEGVHAAPTSKAPMSGAAPLRGHAELASLKLFRTTPLSIATLPALIFNVVVFRLGSVVMECVS